VKLVRIASWLLVGLSSMVWQASALEPVTRFSIHPGPLAITRPVESGKPFTVAGEDGAIFGEQNGTFEAWLYR
jgi:hypothetical protein